MDPINEFYHINARLALANKEFGPETGTELLDRATKFAEESGIARLHCFELLIQYESEWPGKSVKMFDEAEEWVNRTAEDHHPNNPTLWLKALMFVLNGYRATLN